MVEPSKLVKLPQHRRRSGLSEVRIEDAVVWGGSGGYVYVKRQQNYTCRPAWRLLRRTPTLLRELRALRACASLGVKVPTVIHYVQRGLYAELVIGAIADARPLREALVLAGADAPLVLANVARAIARLHDAGWSHGALYSDHILVQAGRDGDVFLIDFEKARRGRHLAAADIERLLRRADFLSEADRRHFCAVYHASRTK